MTLRYRTIASFNARNLVNPGVLYYRRNRYSRAAYNRKLGWMAEQLFRMDADIVCLQEVFHPEPVDDLVRRYQKLVNDRHSNSRAERSRYNVAWHLPNNDATADNPLPGLALLSRDPVLEQAGIQDLSADPIELTESDGLRYSLSKLSRPIMAAKVELEFGVQAWIFNAHLKSKRPLYPDNSQAREPENLAFYERAEGSFRSLALRAGEALALRRAALERLTGSDEPVFVVGDLNDGLGAVTTEMVRGEMPFRGWPIDVRSGFWDVEMYSAVRSHLRRTEHSSIHTHVFNGHYDTLDHILVSQEFFYRNPRRIGDVTFARVYNDHLTDSSVSGAPSLGDASDHGQVVVRFALDSERIERRRTGEYQLFVGDDGRYRFRLTAANGQEIAVSQAYSSKAAAQRGIASVRANANGPIEDLSDDT